MKKWIQRNKTELISMFVLLYAACIAPTFLIEHRMMLFSLKKDCILPSVALLCVIFIVIIGHILSAEFLDRREKLLRLRKENISVKSTASGSTIKQRTSFTASRRAALLRIGGFSYMLPRPDGTGKNARSRRDCVYSI